MKLSADKYVRVLLADDHPVFLGGVRALLEDAADVTIVGEATSGSRALRLITETRPDVAVLDVAMPEMHGIAVAQHLAAEVSPTRVVILSVHEDRTYVREALIAGVRGYVLKRSAGENLVQAVRAVSGSGLYIDPAIADRFVSTSDIMPRTGARTVPMLTDREREVVRLIALGFTNKEVASKLGVTAKSVETYKMRATEKLDIRTRAKIVQYAMLQGWFQSPMQ
ncbi:response regulator transcription factor [Methylobacterium nodulans]|uniref:Two component transcriptional regulator, LuxR family n=1 Tax=Methylobacterium nodulans (strain LMG 21967 / CNCM I-2342 / ORS 2060) TaxID=460265 RepID=B8IGH9_METNO|nr:response regulator transcription factor [Methylobacterium nodulans]ACL55879.1 two component transcriptional regulator, LuxR family [Methylobacterium nodulans ORS 2060]